MSVNWEGPIRSIRPSGTWYVCPDCAHDECTGECSECPSCEYEDEDVYWGPDELGEEEDE
jgi:hypothetical protein